MTTKEPKAPACPRCSRETKRHCERSAGCVWRKCKSSHRDCALVIDFTKGIGWRFNENDPKAKVEYVRF